MQTIKIKKREPDHSRVSVGTRAANLIATISGASNVRVIEETDEQATIGYDWDPAADSIRDIDDRLAPSNLMRADWHIVPGAIVPTSGHRDPRVDPRPGDLLDPSGGAEGPPWLQVNSVADGAVHYYYKPWNETKPMRLDVWRKKATGWKVVL